MLHSSFVYSAEWSKLDLLKTFLSFKKGETTAVITQITTVNSAGVIFTRENSFFTEGSEVLEWL